MLKFPQLEGRRSGASDLWDQNEAGHILTTEYFAQEQLIKRRNGKIVVAGYGGELLTLDIDGRLRPLTSDNDPTLILDGGRVRFGRDRISGLVTENFGNETAGADSFPCNDGRALGSKYTALHAGTVTSMFIRMHADGTPGGNIKCTIHDDVTGDLLGVSAATGTVAGDAEWMEVACSIVIPAPGDYWLIAVANDFNPKIAHLSVGPTEMMRFETYNYASPADPLPTPDDTYAGELCIYAVLEY